MIVPLQWLQRTYSAWMTPNIGTKLNKTKHYGHKQEVAPVCDLPIQHMILKMSYSVAYGERNFYRFKNQFDPRIRGPIQQLYNSISDVSMVKFTTQLEFIKNDTTVP